jgi:mannan endo-1,4-beta-mannosidase
MRSLARLSTLTLSMALVAAALLALPAPATAGPVFVTRAGAAFDLGGQPFRFGGTNNYYLHYKSQAMVDDVFADAAAMNLKVIRAWSSLECGGDRPNSDGGCSAGADLWTQRWSNAAGGPVINTGAGGLQKLDYMLAKANQLGIKLILPLVNNWRDFGGMDQYVTWYGLQFHDQFYTDARIRAAYKNWINTLANRVNTITGVTYKNDPAIFSWELANEPRCIDASLPTSGTCTQQTLLDWADEMSTYINSVDANHMISVGDEGFLDHGNANDWPYNAADGVDHEALTALPNIDFGTYHAYPDSWGHDVAWTTQWIRDHNAAAATLNKPTILEEFGLRDQTARDPAYQTWVDTVRTGGGDGWAFWILTGIQEDGQLYPDFDGFRVTTPSATATLLSNAAVAMSGGGSDTTAPSAPGAPAAANLTSNSATLSWPAATDAGGSGLAGYVVYREQGATDPVLAQPTTNSATLTGLTPNTSYEVYVRARDNAGNLSAPSTSVTFTTQPGAAGNCAVVYSASNWGGSGGFTGSVTITNTGTTATSGWVLAFTFPSGQRVDQGWNATWAQAANSPNVTATSMSYNANLAPSASTQIGFNGTFTTTNTAPSTFTVNGATCTSG